MGMLVNRFAQRPMQRFGQSMIGRGLEQFNTVSDVRDSQTNGQLLMNGEYGQVMQNMGTNLAYGAMLGPFGTLGQMGVNMMGGLGGLFGGGNNQNQ